MSVVYISLISLEILSLTKKYIMSKKKLIRCFIALSALFVVFFVSCEVANDSLTDEEITTKVVGSWHVTEKPSGNNYQVSIATKSSVNVTISNFYNVGVVVSATIVEGSIIIPEQLVNGDTFKGTGVFSNSYKTIQLTYSVNDGSGVENVTNTLTR